MRLFFEKFDFCLETGTNRKKILNLPTIVLNYIGSSAVGPYIPGTGTSNKRK